MFNFARVKDNGTYYGWLLKIESVSDLMLYHERNNNARRITIDSTRGNLNNSVDCIEAMQKNNGKSFVYNLSVLIQKQIESQLEILSKKITIYINKNGGWFYSKTAEELETIKSHSFPNEKPIISRWKNGKHYYAKVGIVDVVVDEKQKWDSYEEAKYAVDKFLKEQL